MLTYDLENRGKDSLYEYLYHCIREDILDGTLKAGERLPSKREMACNHKIAVITVENAYAQLQIEGYITARERSGYYVNAGMEKHWEELRHDSHESLETAADRGRKAGSSLAGGGRKVQNGFGGWETPDRRESYLADFSTNHVVKDSFPFSTWAKLMRRVLAEKEEYFLEKPPAGGAWELREAIAEYLKKAKGLEAEPERIFVGPGTEYLHYLILQLVGHNRLAAVEDPGYKKVGQLYESNGLKCLYIPVDRKGLIVDRLQESNASLVHISPSHHFPTGCVMPADRRHSLLRWAQTQKAYIIEDDYDSEFRFDGRPVPTLASLDDRYVIYMNTFTKTLAPSIRIAYMVLPGALAELLYTRLSFLSGSVSSFEQYTLAAFLKEGYYERHISRMRNAYRQYRARILRCLEESALSGVAEVEEDSAGLHFILHVLREIDDDKFVKDLGQEGIRLLPVSRFCYRNPEKYGHRFIVHYGDIPEENLRKAFTVMQVKSLMET